MLLVASSTCARRTFPFMTTAEASTETDKAVAKARAKVASYLVRDTAISREQAGLQLMYRSLEALLIRTSFAKQ